MKNRFYRPWRTSGSVTRNPSVKMPGYFSEDEIKPSPYLIWIDGGSPLLYHRLKSQKRNQPFQILEDEVSTAT
jgi:hypothetical protein